MGPTLPPILPASQMDLQKLEADYNAKFARIIDKLDDLNQRTAALEKNFLKVLHLLKDNILEAAERLNRLEEPKP